MGAGRPPSLDPWSGRVQLGGGAASQSVDGLPFPSHRELLGRTWSARCPQSARAAAKTTPGANSGKSPIRGFRTGFSKLTQLLSKELFYLIPGPPGGARKLVLFSDSREEAASLANGVERSHYLDLVREALYDELAGFAIGNPLIVEDIKAGGAPQRPQARRFDATHPGAATELQRLLRAATTPVPEIDDPDMAAVLQHRQPRGRGISRHA